MEARTGEYVILNCKNLKPGQNYEETIYPYCMPGMHDLHC